MQHVSLTSAVGQDGDETPFVPTGYTSNQPPHRISTALHRNVVQLLDRVFKASTSSVADVISALLLGLKVANFLCESSEYVHAIDTSKAVYQMTKIYFGLSGRFRKAQVRLQYEAMCILLRSMNAFNVYRECEDRQLFLHEAPRLLQAIQELEAHYTPDRAPLLSEELTPEELERLPVRVRDFLEERRPLVLCTSYLHAQLASFHYAMCNYPHAYRHTCLAIDQMGGKQPHPVVVVEVLRVMCKLCTIRRKYDLGMRVIRYAVSYAREVFGKHNLIYANMLLEYGCLLLNTDKTRRAAEIYRVGLALILDCLPGLSVMASLALEDIAYAYYVLEYTSGNFTYALNCADSSGQILRALGYPNCMQAASANRVKALIIEEIAIDDNSDERKKRYLEEARKLHMDSLELCETTFGQNNIQTAKHYGNLGRLYQSMRVNEEAERMHLKAIEIKERLLGPADFEVGLSVGHLASLYNYDMNRYEDAEKLYLRSVDISLNLFGPTYSGLEYDYRGLQRVYRKLNNQDRLRHYQLLFYQWQAERERFRANEPAELGMLEPQADDVALPAVLTQYREEALFPEPQGDPVMPNQEAALHLAHGNYLTADGTSRSTGY